MLLSCNNLYRCRKIILILVALTVIPAMMSFARAKENGDADILDSTNLHFTGEYCTECAYKKTDKGW